MVKKTEKYGVKKYEDVTSEKILEVLIDGIRRLAPYEGTTQESKEYYDDTVGLLKEYSEKLGEQKLSVGEVVCSTRGLAALMSYRENVAIESSNVLWKPELVPRDNKIIRKIFLECLEEDDLYLYISSLASEVEEIAEAAVYRDIWINTGFATKQALYKEWGMTFGDDNDDIPEPLNLPFTKREMKSFEKVMGREFAEFDEILRGRR